jgi:hypothetical protein
MPRGAHARGSNMLRGSSITGLSIASSHGIEDYEFLAWNLKNNSS